MRVKVKKQKKSALEIPLRKYNDGFGFSKLTIVLVKKAIFYKKL